MNVLTISSDYHIVLPPKVRQSLHLQPGQQLQVVLYDGRIELIPLVTIKEMRGFLKGIDTPIEREGDRV